VHLWNVDQSANRQGFYRQLTVYYLQGELQALYHWCVQEIHGWTRAQAYAHNDREVTEQEMEQWNAVVSRLQDKEPVQYIFQKAHFFGVDLFVDRRVLIPRPETEELVEWVLEMHAEQDLRVLDVGTGSGCIPLALKSQRPTWKVSGMDVSTEALEVAAHNAQSLGLAVDWMLKAVQNDSWGNDMDVIVSNPPYIPDELRGTLDQNVEDHEPSIALFAPDKDPFFFFRRIAEVARKSGVKEVYFETHATDQEALEQELSQVWDGGMERRKDGAGKERFMRLFR